MEFLGLGIRLPGDCDCKDAGDDAMEDSGEA